MYRIHVTLKLTSIYFTSERWCVVWPLAWSVLRKDRLLDRKAGLEWGGGGWVGKSKNWF